MRKKPCENGSPLLESGTHERGRRRRGGEKCGEPRDAEDRAVTPHRSSPLVSQLGQAALLLGAERVLDPHQQGDPGSLDLPFDVRMRSRCSSTASSSTPASASAQPQASGWSSASRRQILGGPNRGFQALPAGDGCPPAAPLGTNGECRCRRPPPPAALHGSCRRSSASRRRGRGPG